MIENVAEAMIRSQGVRPNCWDWNMVNPSGRVLLSIELMMIRGQRNWFHEDRNVKMPRVAVNGLIRGRMMRQKIAEKLAPSTRAGPPPFPGRGKEEL